MKILIIEDEEAIRQTMQDMLELNGHEVLAASNGLEGVKLAATGPDFIFCDVSMPGLDGFGVVEAVRQHEKGRLVPFVFLTAKADRADRRQGMALGADDYITKPFSEKEILEAITARTRRFRPLQARLDEMMEQQKNQVGANWSHELLTPLNSMLGGLQLLEMEADTISRKELKEILVLIRDGVERQEKLSRKLIRYFELERSKYSPKGDTESRCQTDKAIEAGSRFAGVGIKRESDIHLRCEPATVRMPEAFLSEAIAELVDNALRFSNQGQSVTVTGTRLSSHYRIEVSDEGVGMSPEERAGVAPFTQFGRGKREQQGLGLGLSIVRSITRVASGEMSIEEGPGGRGLLVSLLLPLG